MCKAWSYNGGSFGNETPCQTRRVFSQSGEGNSFVRPDYSRFERRRERRTHQGIANEKEREAGRLERILSFTVHTVNHVTRHSVVIHHTRPASTICWQAVERNCEPRKSRIERKNSGHRSGSCSNPSRAGYSRTSRSFIRLQIIRGLLSRSFVAEHVGKVARVLLTHDGKGKYIS